MKYMSLKIHNYQVRTKTPLSGNFDSKTTFKRVAGLVSGPFQRSLQKRLQPQLARSSQAMPQNTETAACLCGGSLIENQLSERSGTLDKYDFDIDIDDYPESAPTNSDACSGTQHSFMDFG